jgi:multiple sugar transport system ATP-binding protein
MASITLEQVTKRYRDVAAVSDLDLKIDDGEMMVLIGPSGCGKTTALRLIAGLEHPDRGRIRFDGKDVSEVSPAERNIAMVFEGYALFPHFAVRQNLAFSLQVRDVPKEQVSRRVAEVAQALELQDLLERKPQALATGEAQSTAVGRAIIREMPSVLLLDDALSHLDAHQRLEARAEVSRLHRDLGCTIVSVTHDQAEALAVGARVAVMDDGRLKQVGTPEEVYVRPANVFVAGFIGDPPMNLLPVHRERIDGQDVLRADGLELPLPPAPTIPSRDLVVGFRAEDAHRAQESSAGEGRLHGHCDLVEYLGSELRVHVRVGSAEVIVRERADADIHAGDTVDLAIPAAHLRLFDAASGMALS